MSCYKETMDDFEINREDEDFAKRVAAGEDLFKLIAPEECPMKVINWIAMNWQKLPEDKSIRVAEWVISRKGRTIEVEHENENH